MASSVNVLAKRGPDPLEFLLEGIDAAPSLQALNKFAKEQGSLMMRLSEGERERVKKAAEHRRAFLFIERPP